MNRSEIIKLAQSQIGVPFHHQGRVPGVGLDCVGLVRYPYVALGYAPETADEKGYSRDPNPPKMRELLEQWLEPITLDEAKPGDILWLKTGQPQHLAIYNGDTIIHCTNHGPQRVVECTLDDKWKSRIVAVYRLKHG